MNQCFLICLDIKNPPIAEITLPRTDSIRGATLFHDIVLFARYHHISGS